MKIVAIKQSLDMKSIQNIKTSYRQGSSIWLIDGPLLTGRLIAKVKENLISELDCFNDIKIGVLEWVKFTRCKEANWRKCADFIPDAYGVKIMKTDKPYVEYPWEYTDYKRMVEFNKEGL
jgi:hypothetical protein